MRGESLTVSSVGYALACIAPGAHFLAFNAAELQKIGSEAILVVLALCAAMWLVGLGLAVAPVLLFKRWPVSRALSVGVVAVFLFFAHQPIRAWLGDYHAVSDSAGRIVYVVVLAVALGATWRAAAHAPVRLALALASGLMIALSLARLVPVALATYGLAPEPRAAGGSRVLPAGGLSKENVYFVVLDGYVGPAAQKKYVHTDNDAFVRAMEALGYVDIEQARSNYTSTHLSLTSTFALDYLVTEQTPNYKYRLNRFPLRFPAGQEPQFVRQLAAAGYDFIHVGNSVLPCYQRAGIECLSNSANYGPFNYVAASFLLPTRLPQVFARLWGSYDALTPLAAALPDLLATRKPFFAFVHHLAPHPPYRKLDCSPHPEITGREDLDVVRRQYSDTIECVNREVLSLARVIRDRDPSAIVVFQADHGSGFAVDLRIPLSEWTDAAIDERSSILSLVRAPEPCRRWLRPDLSPINTMRFVAGCLGRQPPAYLPERTYIGAYELNADYGRVRDVTARLRGRDGEAGRR